MAKTTVMRVVWVEAFMVGLGYKIEEINDFLAVSGFETKKVGENRVEGLPPHNGTIFVCEYEKSSKMPVSFSLRSIGKNGFRIVESGRAFSLGFQDPSGKVPQEITGIGETINGWSIFVVPVDNDLVVRYEALKRQETSQNSLTSLASSFKEENLSPLEICEFLRKRVAEENSPDEIARALGKSTTWFYHYRAIDDLHPDLKPLLGPGLEQRLRMRMGCVEILVQIPPDQQLLVWEAVSKLPTKDLITKRLKELVKAKKGIPEKKIA